MGVGTPSETTSFALLAISFVGANNFCPVTSMGVAKVDSITLGVASNHGSELTLDIAAEIAGGVEKEPCEPFLLFLLELPKLNCH